MIDIYSLYNQAIEFLSQPISEGGSLTWGMLGIILVVLFWIATDGGKKL